MTSTDIRRQTDDALARQLRDRLEPLLDELAGIQEGTAGLYQQLAFRSGEPLRVVLTGATSSGKSTLISALTDREIQPATGVDPTTDTIQKYPWGSMVLVDTPGISGGLEEHDALAEESLRTADFIVFTLTHHGFEPDVHRYLMHILEDLKMAPQTVAVINKADQSELDDEGRERQLAKDLGRDARKVQWVACSATDYLDALSDQDQQAVEESRIPDVRRALVRIAEDQDFVARARTPLQAVARTALEALEMLEKDLSSEEAEEALETFTRRRELCQELHQSAQARLDAAYHQFHGCAVEIGERYADAAEKHDVQDSAREDARQQIEGELTEAWRQFVTTVRQGMQEQAVQTREGLAQLWPEAAEQAAAQLEPDQLQSDQEEGALPTAETQTKPQKDRLRNTRESGVFKKVGAAVRSAAQEPQKVWDHRIGRHSVGYKITSSTEKLLKRSGYSPQQATADTKKISQKLAKIPMAAALDLTAGLFTDVREMQQESSETKAVLRVRETARQQVLAHCETETAKVLTPVREAAAGIFEELSAEVDRQIGVSKRLLHERSVLREALSGVREEALAELDSLGIKASRRSVLSRLVG